MNQNAIALPGPRLRKRPDCRHGRHVPLSTTTFDADGIEHGRCRRCGCELRRLPTINRWYRSGLMG